MPIPFFRVQQGSSGSSFDEHELTARLVKIVGADHVLTDLRELTSYMIDWTGRYVGVGRIVVRPDSTAQVADIVGVCREMSVPIVPQGGNTGLVGGSVPLQGEVVISTRRLSSIGDVDRVARQVTVGAGVSLGTVHGSALDAELRYPVDFGARDSATIGGAIATNAGGISVLRYGMTRRHVVGIEAVLGTGQVVSHLGGLVKDNTGYDLSGLLCGSEGTLGIVTAARLQLVPLHRRRTTALVGFDDLESAMAAVGTVCAANDTIDALEVFLETGVRLVAETFGRAVPFAAPVYLLMEASANTDQSEQLSTLLDVCAGVTAVAVAGNDAQREQLWALREDHTPAINTLGPPLKFDVTVPVGRLAPFATSVHDAVTAIAPDSRTFLFGHAADGNLHVNISGVDHESPEVPVIEDAVMDQVVRHAGSVSAEHGIGTAKKRFLALSRSSADIDTMRAVKRALDPDGIMNPNVLFDQTS